MAQLNGIATKLKGSVGQFTFKQLHGGTVVSEKITNTTNPRTSSQQKHRMKWPNLIKTYSGISPLLNNAFEGKAPGISDYNMFVKTNFKGSNVYLTKGEAASKSCVAAPYQITDGSLPSIVLTGNAGSSVTDISLGSVTISDNTTIKEFSLAVISNNADYDLGDQISFIRVIQEKHPITGNPICKFVGECVVLDKNSEVKLRTCVSAAGFSVTNNKLACSLDSAFQGAYAWVHSRKKEGETLVSSQVFTVKNDTYTEYSSEDAYKRAVATYGGEKTTFLTPDANSAAANVSAGGGSSSGSGGGSGNSYVS